MCSDVHAGRGAASAQTDDWHFGHFFCLFWTGLFVCDVRLPVRVGYCCAAGHGRGRSYCSARV